ncbi:hypothetical protein MRX96_004059 [Rhipicephalus microplus]
MADQEAQQLVKIAQDMRARSYCNYSKKATRNFKAIAIASNMNDLTMPCGACRQFIIEFGKDIVIYAAAADGRVLTKRADELLPLSFGASDLPSK